MSIGTSAQRGGRRIAVIIPCYRDGPLVHEAVRSLRGAEPLEIVVIDDASDDALTRAALAPLAAEGVRVIRNSRNGGVGFSRNVGLDATSAPFVFPLDADDLAMPGMLGHMADILEQRPEAAVCFGDYLEFGDSNILRGVPEELDAYRLAYTNEYPVSALFRRTVLETVGGWPRKIAYEDWHLWMTLAERGEIGVHAGPGLPTFRRRLHGERMLHAAKRSHSTIYSRLRRDHPDLFEDLEAHRRRSPLSPIRKRLYPFVYGGRKRRAWEPHIKRTLDRFGVWTLRR